MSGLLARLRAAVQGLSPSEQRLVGAAVVIFVAAGLFYGVLRPVIGGIAANAGRLERAEASLAEVRVLRERYDDVHGRLSVVERRIQRGPKGEIFTTLEDLAKQSALKVDSMEPRTSPASEEYRETKVQVALRSVTLAQVVNYLHRIEAAEQVLSIKSLRIRTRPDKPDLLDVTFTVSSFEPVS